MSGDVRVPVAERTRKNFGFLFQEQLEGLASEGKARPQEWWKVLIFQARVLAKQDRWSQFSIGLPSWQFVSQALATSGTTSVQRLGCRGTAGVHNMVGSKFPGIWLCL